MRHTIVLLLLLIRLQKILSQENIATALNKSIATESRYESGEILEKNNALYLDIFNL